MNIKPLTIYLIPGLGCDETVFSRLEFPANCKIANIKWLPVMENEQIGHYAKRLSAQVNRSEPFALMGLSFGGIMAIELAKHLNPERIILLSSIKHYYERPLGMAFLESTSVHRLLQPKWLIEYSFWHQLVFGSLNEEDEQLVNAFKEKVDIPFNKWALDQAIKWKNKNIPENVLHIHGTSDVLFPICYIKNARKVSGGTHFMVINKANEINHILAEELAA